MIGFSQAGWVLPLAANMSEDIKYIIPVSGAVDWMEQGHYTAKNLILEDGYNQEEIHEVIAFREEIDQLLLNKRDYKTYMALLDDKAPKAYGDPLTIEDWEFYQLNVNTNVKDSLKGVQCPILALFGDKDVYVDVEKSMTVYEQILSLKEYSDYTIKIFENADHSLLKTKEKHFVHGGLPMYMNMMKWEILGAKAFPDDYFETIIEFINQFNYK